MTASRALVRHSILILPCACHLPGPLRRLSLAAAAAPVCGAFVPAAAAAALAWNAAWKVSCSGAGVYPSLAQRRSPLSSLSPRHAKARRRGAALADDAGNVRKRGDGARVTYFSCLPQPPAQHISCFAARTALASSPIRERSFQLMAHHVTREGGTRGLFFFAQRRRISARVRRGAALRCAAAFLSYGGGDAAPQTVGTYCWAGMYEGLAARARAGECRKRERAHARLRNGGGDDDLEEA